MYVSVCVGGEFSDVVIKGVDSMACTFFRTYLTVFVCHTYTLHYIHYTLYVPNTFCLGYIYTIHTHTANLASQYILKRIHKHTHTHRYLSENRIESFENDTFARKTFKLLDLSHNHLRSYPYAINRGIHDVLKLNNNPIGNLPSDAFTAFNGDIPPFGGVMIL